MQWLKKQEKLMSTDQYGLPLVAASKMATLIGAVTLTCVVGFVPADWAAAQEAESAVSVTPGEAAEPKASMLAPESAPTAGEPTAGEPTAGQSEASGSPTPDTPPAIAPTSGSEEEEEEYVQPWDYSPYKIMIWIASDDPQVSAASIEAPLRRYLDREYSSIWRMTIEDAPRAVASNARRDIGAIDFTSLAGRDPVVAIKRDHKDAVRLRSASSVKLYIPKVLGPSGLIDEVKQLGAAAGDESLLGVTDLLESTDSNLATLWAQPESEAILTTRGMAMSLSEPEAKLIELPLAGLVTSTIDSYDKIFLVHIQHDEVPGKISIVECQTLMQYFGDVVNESYVTEQDIPDALGRGLTRAFSPEVRIDDAGIKTATGIVRAAGLVVDPSSDSLVRTGDVLIPMVRKNDRNGRAILIGPIDWAYLLVTDPVQDDIRTIERALAKMAKNTETETADDIAWRELLSRVKAHLEKNERARTMSMGENEKRALQDISLLTMKSESNVKMEYYSGRPGGLQGRQNKRSFRRAIRIRPKQDQTLLRLHVKKRSDLPLIGYELYEKELYSKSMTFIGRTDWNGRLKVTKTEDPLRLLYVKNGGAVLARLPIVPGLTDLQVADLLGDDMRLQAEAYLNGVNNAVIDLVALRKLLGARIRKRLRAGQMEKAEELIDALRKQPSKEILSNDLDRKQAYFLDVVDTANGRRKVDNMFSVSRGMLDKQITQKDIRDIEADLVLARKNGGVLPPEEESEDEYDASANKVESKPTKDK